MTNHTDTQPETLRHKLMRDLDTINVITVRNKELPNLTAMMELIDSYAAAETKKARIEELEYMKKYSEQHIAKQAIYGVYDDIIKGSILAMIPLVHVNDRIDALQRETEQTK